MRKTLKLVALPALLFAVGFLVVSAEEAPTLVSADVDAVTPPKAKRSSQIAPYYPATAQLTRVNGTVVVAATVNAKGRVDSVDLVYCDQPNMGFEDSAMDAVKTWRFKPATKAGAAVESMTYVRLVFRAPDRYSRDGFVQTDGFFTPMASIATGRPRPTLPPEFGAQPAGHSNREFSTPNRPSCIGSGSKCLYDQTNIISTSRQVALPQPQPTPTNPGGN